MTAPYSPLIERSGAKSEARRKAQEEAERVRKEARESRALAEAIKRTVSVSSTDPLPTRVPGEALRVKLDQLNAALRSVYA